MIDLGARATAAFLGAAVGDALGWPQENRSSNIDRKMPPAAMAFRSWRRRGGGRFSPYEEDIRAGEFSDDTQMLCAVARSIDHGELWYDWFTRVELPSFPPYQRGAGRALLGACRAWTAGATPWEPHKMANPGAYFNAGGNGGAMRILPHAVVAAAQGRPVDHDRLFADVTATHGHPRAAVGAAVHAAALRVGLTFDGTLGYGELIEMLLDQRGLWAVTPDPGGVPFSWMAAWTSNVATGFDDAWRTAVDEMVALLAIAHKGMNAGALASEEETLSDLGCTATKVVGAGTVSAAGAVYLASRSAANPRAGLLAAAYLSKADTDTLASMTGSILGAFAGREWMSSLDTQVQDHTYLMELATTISEGRVVDRPLPTGPSKTSVDRFLGALDVVSPGEGLEYVDGRRALVEGRETLQTKSAALSAERFRLSAGDGQTLYLVRTHRITGRATKEPNQPSLPLEGSVESSDESTVVRVGVKVSVTDLEVMRRFYGDVIGMTPSRSGSSFVTFNDVLALTGGENLRSSGQSRVSIHLDVFGIESLWRRVQHSAIRVVDPLAVEGGRRRFRCLDPEGNVLEVRDAAHPEASAASR